MLTMPKLPSILYLHGLNSSPDSLKAQQLSRAMAQLGLAAQLRVIKCRGGLPPAQPLAFAWH